jgi:phosphoribosyl-ATP pyrophosphohydrolase
MIDDLVKTIRDRKNSSPDKSYTSSLLSDGLSKCIDKLEEEFGE